MAVIENKSTEIGDVILIQAEVPIVGLVALTDFIDNTNGEDANKFFYKEFRFTIDGINYSDWKELTTQNIADVEVEPTDTFIAEYRYTRVGTDSTGELTYIDSDLSGEYLKKNCGKTFTQSIFSDFFKCDDTKVLSWCINVTEKIYQKGIVPEFITRGQSANQERVDRDYIDFWRTVACFFAYHVIYAREFRSFNTNKELLSDFLKQKGMYFCGEDNISVLYDILNNHFREIRRRGTASIYKVEGDYHGELLKLLCFNKERDEFLFNLTDPNQCGFWLDNSSPLYKGSNYQQGLSKGYEKTEGFSDITKYPLLNAPALNIDNGFLVASASTTETGIGGVEKRITINHDLNYEITAYLKVDSGVDIDFGVRCFDSLGNEITLKNSTNQNDNNWFFQLEKLNQSSQYYLLRGVIYKSGEPDLSTDEARLDAGFGQHLRFKEEAVKIVPQLTFKGTGVVRIQDFKVSVSSLPYSTAGLQQVTNFISVIAENKNGDYSNLEVESVIRKYLIPYNSTLQAVWLGVEE